MHREGDYFSIEKNFERKIKRIIIICIDVERCFQFVPNQQYPTYHEAAYRRLQSEKLCLHIFFGYSRQWNIFFFFCDVRFDRRTFVIEKG